MTFNDVKNNYYTGKYAVGKEVRHSPPRYDYNHVFDADKSVKWNREEVERRNSEMRAEWEVLWKQLQKCRADFDDDLFEAAHAEFKINRTQFNKIFDHVMEITENDYRCAYFVDDFIEFLEFFFDVVNS